MASFAGISTVNIIGADSSTVGDDDQIFFSTDLETFLVYDTLDADAATFKLQLEAGGVVAVPVFAIGVGINDVDLGANGVNFAGLTQPHSVVIDLDRDSAIGWGFSEDDVGIVYMELGNGTTREHIVPDVASDTFGMLAAAQTFTNKTLTAAALDGATTIAGATMSGTIDMNGQEIQNPGVEGTGSEWDAFNVNLINSRSGAPMALTVRNDSDTASSEARVRAIVLGTSAGEPFFQASAPTVTWVMGADNVNSDRFVIGRSVNLGNDNAIRITNASPAVVSFDTGQGADFDYICERCGSHGLNYFSCCGLVEWHADNVDYRALVERRPGALDYFVKIGVIDLTYSPFGVDQTFVNVVPMMGFLGSMAYQNYQEIAALRARVEELEAMWFKP